MQVGDTFDVGNDAFVVNPEFPDNQVPPQIKVQGWTFVLDGDFDRSAPDDLETGVTAELVSATTDGASLTGATLEVRTSNGSIIHYTGPVDCS